MKKSEKIEIAILIVLAIILAVNVWAGKTNSKTIYGKPVCDAMCHLVNQDSWSFPRAGAYNIFSTKEDCVSACQARFKQ